MQGKRYSWQPKQRQDFAMIEEENQQQILLFCAAPKAGQGPFVAAVLRSCPCTLQKDCQLDHLTHGVLDHKDTRGVFFVGIITACSPQIFDLHGREIFCTKFLAFRTPEITDQISRCSGEYRSNRTIPLPFWHSKRKFSERSFCHPRAYTHTLMER